MMNPQKIIQAWKDEAFRGRLSDEEQAHLPENPAGDLELDEETLDAVAGGGTENFVTIGCCALTGHLLSVGCCGGPSY